MKLDFFFPPKNFQGQKNEVLPGEEGIEGGREYILVSSDMKCFVLQVDFTLV